MVLLNANGPLPAMDFAAPNVGNLPTPAGPVPTPSVSIGFKATVPPTQVKYFTMCMPAQTMESDDPVTVGCVGPGVVSGTMFAEDEHLRCSTLLCIDGGMGTRWLDQTGQNGEGSDNAVGTTIVPAQVCVIVLR